MSPENTSTSLPNDSFNIETFQPRGILINLWQPWLELFRDNNNTVPLKKSISMQKFRSVLPDMMIAERIDDDTVRVRLSGTRLDDIADESLTGKNMLDLYNHIRESINRMYSNVTTYPCGFYYSEDITISADKAIELDILVLPLIANNGEQQFFISGYHFTNRHPWSPVSDKDVQQKPRHLNQLGYIDLGHGTPTISLPTEHKNQSLLKTMP